MDVELVVSALSAAGTLVMAVIALYGLVGKWFRLSRDVSIYSVLRDDATTDAEKLAVHRIRSRIYNDIDGRGKGHVTAFGILLAAACFTMALLLVTYSVFSGGSSGIHPFLRLAWIAEGVAMIGVGIATLAIMFGRPVKR